MKFILNEDEYDELVRKSYNEAIEKVEYEIANAWFMLSLGSPEEGPFTRQDRTVKEVQEQILTKVKALKKLG